MIGIPPIPMQGSADGGIIYAPLREGETSISRIELGVWRVSFWPKAAAQGRPVLAKSSHLRRGIDIARRAHGQAGNAASSNLSFTAIFRKAPQFNELRGFFRSGLYYCVVPLEGNGCIVAGTIRNLPIRLVEGDRLGASDGLAVETSMSGALPAPRCSDSNRCSVASSNFLIWIAGGYRR